MVIPTRLLLPAATAAALTLAAAVSFARAAEVAVGDLAVTEAWARATPPGATIGAAYVTVENRGAAPDRLLSVAAPAAAKAELHETVEENGVARMRPLLDAGVPPGDSLAMRPGGAHIMLMDLSAPLKAGESLPLTLVFEVAGSVTLRLEVAPIGAAGPAEAHHN